MRKHLLAIVFLFVALMPVKGQQAILNDSTMFISQQVDSLTEAERYFNPLYLIVQKGKEHLKQQLVRGSICDCDTTLPNRRIGIFSVAADRYVTFSQGNLQYFPAAKLWKFADNQYDILGNANQHLSPTFRNWVDLFGYSANNTTAPFGISTSTNNADYTGDFVDWGNNWICGDKPNTWRTLSKDEWEYLLEHRVNASSLYAVAQVANVSGMIILPDNWILPSGITFQPGFHQNDLSFAQHQTFTEQQWALMERAGAVFLPAAGIVSSNIIRSPMEGAHYQSSDKESNSTNYWFGFRSSYYTIRSSEVGTRRSVRLVRDTQLVDCDTIVKSLQLSVTDTTVYQGESFTLNVQTGYCIDGAIQVSLSDNSLAQIEQLSLNSYHITTAKTGTLVLTATAIDYPNITAQCTITIRDQHLSGVFSIGGDKHIIFSPGNLQYLPATSQWRFAETQYQYMGENNTHLSTDYNHWIDLFGYSANNNTAPFGVSTSTNNADYAGDFVDWGTQTISSEKPGKWRTLNKDEWEYLLNKRDNATQLRSHAQIDSINGFIFLPDNWVCPEGIDFEPATRYESQQFSLEQWNKLEQAGAVFLPAAGRRQGKELLNSNEHGNYCSSTRRNSTYADYFAFTDADVYVNAIYTVTRGRSIRLVCDAVPSTKHYCYGFTQEQWDNATASWGHGGRGHAPADQSCIQGTMVYGIRLKVSRAGSLNVYKVPTLLETTEENFELVATLTTDSTGLQDFDFPQPIYIAPNEYLVFGKPSEDASTLVPCYNNKGGGDSYGGTAHYIGDKEASVVKSAILMVEFYSKK